MWFTIPFMATKMAFLNGVDPNHWNKSSSSDDPSKRRRLIFFKPFFLPSSQNSLKTLPHWYDRGRTKHNETAPLGVYSAKFWRICISRKANYLEQSLHAMLSKKWPNQSWLIPGCRPPKSFWNTQNIPKFPILRSKTFLFRGNVVLSPYIVFKLYCQMFLNLEAEQLGPVCNMFADFWLILEIKCHHS